MTQPNTISERNPKACRACDNVRGNQNVPGHVTLYTCAKCNAIFGDCYLGDSYSFVKPFMTAAEVPAESQRYFDFSCLGSAGLTRRHGWYDPSTKLITQVG